MAVYQTNIIDGVQDSSTLMEITILLSSAAYEALSRVANLHTAVSVALRRFDNRHVQLYCSDTGTMKVVKLNPSMFQYHLDHAMQALQVLVHRKYLPVSKAHGDAPFKFVWVLHPVQEVVSSSPFLVGSKEPQPTGPKPPPKRLRAPSAKKPFMALPDAVDAAIDQALAPRGTKRQREPSSPDMPVGSPSAGSPASAASDVPASSPKKPRAEAPPVAVELPRCAEFAAPMAGLPPPPPLHFAGSLGSLPPLESPLQRASSAALPPLYASARAFSPFML